MLYLETPVAMPVRRHHGSSTERRHDNSFWTTRLASSWTLFLAMTIFFSSDAGFAQDYICCWTKEPINVDGSPTEAAWKKAIVIDDFRVPMTHAITKTTTKLRLLWDRQYLYFLAELEDHDLFADILEHDGKTWNNDVFELFFWPDSKSPGYYELQVNAAGTMMDVFFPDRESVDFDKRKSADQFDWKTKVQRKGTLDNRTDRDEGWVVEGRIPWNDLIKTGGRPEVDKIWKVAFCRYDYTLGKDPELSSCARLSQVNFHLLADYANLRFAGPEESDSRRK